MINRSSRHLKSTATAHRLKLVLREFFLLLRVNIRSEAGTSRAVREAARTRPRACDLKSRESVQGLYQIESSALLPRFTNVNTKIVLIGLHTLPTLLLGRFLKINISFHYSVQI